ncbi:hypothetical protein AKJ09_03729 [Labilithrix luteola]|uniref:Uncharacterized protein n=1 Tax=Labilithrix luteola TaxID=1391654 RepID=A0A0K1PU55_9BACT|nr:hypothetical protein AKJ09_03729 [Labilithrix luteola]
MRVLGGLLYAASPRLRWSQLLRRTFDVDVDVETCPNCKAASEFSRPSRRRRRWHSSLPRVGLSTEPPRLHRARDPTTLDGDAT